MFQLHPNGYRFADGHVVKLELLPKDSNTAAGNSYGRTSNNQQNVTVENLELRLPVLESPGALGGLVQDPAPKVAAAGLPARAPDFPTLFYPRPKGATPLRASLVPGVRGVHGPEPRRTARRSAFPSCNPPQQASDFLTVGTPDANGEAPEFAGVVALRRAAR